MNRLKILTRIPLPVEPLPALPKHLVENKKREIVKEVNMMKEVNERYPLRTLNTQPNLALPGPSNAKPVANRPKMQIFDAKHVTLRQRVERLDWDYKVFKDDRGKDEQVITISDDEDTKMEEFKFFVENRQKNCLGESKSAVTPAVKSPSLEPSRVKNIKRSLKRPHSRELQGISPLCKEPRVGEEKVKRRLHFNEPLQERLMSPDFRKFFPIMQYTQIITYYKEYHSYLLSDTNENT